jgi:hypothetical protein
MVQVNKTLGMKPVFAALLELIVPLYDLLSGRGG